MNYRYLEEGKHSFGKFIARIDPDINVDFAKFIMKIIYTYRGRTYLVGLCKRYNITAGYLFKGE